MKTEFKNLLIDFYELTMGQGYFNKKVDGKIAYFDLFFRKAPDNAGFVIANGVQKCVEYLEQFHFSNEDMEYLKKIKPPTHQEPIGIVRRLPPQFDTYYIGFILHIQGVFFL